MSGQLLYESLHNHTVISDGQLAHLEVLDEAEAAGFGIISFTDHDILPRPEDMRSLRAYTGPVDWNIGIEITSGLPNELGGGPASLFHILGLDIEPDNTQLREYCELAKDARLERLERTVINLKKVGLTISLDECLELAGVGIAGTPHITRVVIKDEDNIHLMEEIAEAIRIKSLVDPALRPRYDEMMMKVRDGHRHPYIRDLFLNDDPFVPGVYVPYLYALDMDSSVELIRDAGGVAVVAHWPTVRDTITADHLTQIAVESRIDGLELRSVFDSGATIHKDISFLGDLARKNNLLQTVGVDGHDPGDFHKFAAIPGALDMTVGQWVHIQTRNRTY